MTHTARRPILRPMAWLLGAALATAASAETGVLRRPHYELRFPESIRAEAERLDAHMQAAVDSLTAEFAAHDPEALLRHVTCVVHVYDVPNEHASEATALVRTQATGSGPDRRYEAEIHLLAPSAHGPDARSMVGQVKDEHYFRKVFAHEYSTILMEQVLGTKPEGWRSGAPAWFVQGYQEYLGLMHSGEVNQQVTFRSYLAVTAGDRERVSESWGLQVRDPYLDGAMLLAFMHEEFGRARVQKILTSPRPNFGAAISAELGLDPAAFHACWSVWLERRGQKEAP